MNKKITFTLINDTLEDAAEFPSPAINNLPKWYKEMDGYIGGKKTIFRNFANPTMKKCIPVLDSMATGYIIKTWTDIYFDSNDITWSMTDAGIKAVEGHPLEQLENYPISSYYQNAALKWINPWKITTPKGYSCLFITPVGHNLPFKLIEGIVDTDTFPLTINFPFLLKNNFNGLMPRGTPIVQVIPFKRDSFKSENEKFNEKKYARLKNLHDSSFINKYKNLWWSKKEYK